MKAFSVWFLFLFIYINVACQSKQYTYYLDENLVSTSKEKALIIGNGYWDEGNFKLECFANTTNQLFLIASFLDSTLELFNGSYLLYHSNYKIKEEGIYERDEKIGNWKTYDNTGKILDSIIYEKGVKIKFAKFQYYYHSEVGKNNKITTDSSKYSFEYSFTDSLKNEFINQYYSLKNDKLVIKRDVFFVGNNGIMKTYDSLQNVTIDTLFTREANEAEYIGGDKGWIRFLQENLRPDVPIENGAKPGIYTVIVKFIVNKDGTLSDVELENNPGYGMGKEALRVINLTKKWKSAVQYGKLVKAYRRQPITFQIVEEKRRRLF